MKYLGKKPQAGQLALGFPVQSAVKEKPERALHRRWAVELWPGTAPRLNAPQSRSRNRWHCWQPCFWWFWLPALARLPLLSCQVGWAESGCLVLCVGVHKLKNKIRNENKARRLRRVCDDRQLESAALCRLLGRWWVLSYRMWQRWMEAASPLLMLDLVERRNWLVIYHP